MKCIYDGCTAKLSGKKSCGWIKFSIKSCVTCILPRVLTVFYNHPGPKALVFLEQTKGPPPAQHRRRAFFSRFHKASLGSLRQIRSFGRRPVLF